MTTAVTKCTGRARAVARAASCHRGEVVNTQRLRSWDVEFLCDLVNSGDSVLGVYVNWFKELNDVTAYLERNGRSSPECRVVPEDLPALYRLRASLSRIFGSTAAEQLGIIDDLCRRHVSGIRVSAEVDGQMDAVPRATGYAGTMAARVALALAQLAETETLDRLKRCARPSCAGVFADLTRPGTRLYCHGRCATSASSAAYRARRNEAARSASGGDRT